MTIGQNIRKYRKEEGLTQAELAKKIGVFQHHIYRWEKDIVIPSIETIKKLANVLEVSTDGLLFSEEERKKLKISDKELLEKISKIEKLGPEDREALARLMDAFILKIKPQKE